MITDLLIAARLPLATATTSGFLVSADESLVLWRGLKYDAGLDMYTIERHMIKLVTALEDHYDLERHGNEMRLIERRDTDVSAETPCTTEAPCAAE